MLEIDSKVEKGIMFLMLEGSLNTNTFMTLDSEINYLLYGQGFSNFVIDFSNISNLDDNIFMIIQSLLVEIFLNCGKVVVSGLSEIGKRKIGYTKDKLFYVEKNIDAFKYLYI